MREKLKASIVSFTGYRKECLQVLFGGVSYHQTHYKFPKDTNKTLLHREKVGKTQKSKSQSRKVRRKFRREFRMKFHRGCKNLQPLQI